MRGASTTDVTTVSRKLLQHDAVYSGHSLIIANLDVKTGFGEMDHSVMEEALRWKGRRGRTSMKLMKDFTDVEATLTISGCRCSVTFQLTKCGKQG